MTRPHVKATINGQPAYLRHTVRDQRQPAKPSVRFIGDPVPDAPREPLGWRIALFLIAAAVTVWFIVPVVRALLSGGA